MLEIEMKFAVLDFAPVLDKLATLGGKSAEPRVESDHYFNAPDRDFRKTDEAFRLRQIGEQNFLTYKGPKEPGLVKTRVEHEIALLPGQPAANDHIRLLELLGYRRVATVQKTRTSVAFTRDGFPLAVCLDEVATVGKYVEVEIVAASADRDRAQQTIVAVARELGLEHPEPRSYLRLLVGNK